MVPCFFSVLVSVGKVSNHTGWQLPPPCQAPEHGAYSQYLFTLQMYIVMSWQSHQCDYSSIQILLMRLYVVFVWHLMLN